MDTFIRGGPRKIMGSSSATCVVATPTLPALPIKLGDLQNTHQQHDTDRGVCQSIRPARNTVWTLVAALLEPCCWSLAVALLELFIVGVRTNLDEPSLYSPLPMLVESDVRRIFAHQDQN